jgi:hypothetical protein
MIDVDLSPLTAKVESALPGISDIQRAAVLERLTRLAHAVMAQQQQYFVDRIYEARVTGLGYSSEVNGLATSAFGLAKGDRLLAIDGHLVIQWDLVPPVLLNLEPAKIFSFGELAVVDPNPSALDDDTYDDPDGTDDEDED